MLLKKIQTSVLLALLTVIVLAWSYLFYQHWQMNAQSMKDMWMPPAELFAWSYLDFSLIFVMWAIMMAAMMLPSTIPMILAVAQVSQQRKTKYYQLTFIFTLAYLCVWFLFSGLLTHLQWQMHGLAWLSPMMENRNPLLAAGILILAGIYQFLPIKNVCLRHCRTPMSFLLNEWRWAFGRFFHGIKSRYDLPGMLLGANADYVRGRNHEFAWHGINHSDCFV